MNKTIRSRRKTEFSVYTLGEIYKWNDTKEKEVEEKEYEDEGEENYQTIF